MSQATPPAPPPATPAGPRPRRRPPTWGIIAFLLLLGALLIVNEIVSSTGPPIRWIENDLDAALARAAQTGQRVLLYLYRPDDPVHARNELEVFSRRWAREALTDVVCVRVNLDHDPPLGQELGRKYGCSDTPCFVVLDRRGKLLGFADGIAVDERQFRTHVAAPARRPQP